MTIKNKIISGLLLSTILTSGLYASCEMEQKGDFKKSMMKNGKMHDERVGILSMFKELNLTAEQKTKIEQIIDESRKNIKSEDEAFSKDGFDKAKYIQIVSEKRDNMLKSHADIIEKSYAVLTSKQKEQLKVLIDLRKEKMSQKIEEKTKG